MVQTPPVDPDPASSAVLAGGWSRDLFKLDTKRISALVSARVALAVGVPLIGATLAGYPLAGIAGGATAMCVSLCDIGSRFSVRVGTMAACLAAILVGGTLGHELGGTPHANELIVLCTAFFTGWVSGSHVGIAAVARFFAVITAVAAGMQLGEPGILRVSAAGGLLAIVIAIVMWKVSGLPPDDNEMDWRAGVRRAIGGADAGPWFAVCFAVAATVALFAAGTLGVARPYWATMVVLMVMRREGTVSLKLTIHYIAGTLIGIPIAWVLFSAIHSSLAIAILATAVAAFARVGFAINPALGFTAFTVFLMLVVDLALRHAGAAPHLLSQRLYDVGVGCALALLGTWVAAIGQRAFGSRHA